MVGEGLLTMRVPFHLELALPSSSLESEVDASDPGEK
jgi:hypothetical protein